MTFDAGVDDGRGDEVVALDSNVVAQAKAQIVRKEGRPNRPGGRCEEWSRRLPPQGVVDV